MTALLSAVTANTTGTGIVPVNVGEIELVAYGTWGSGNVLFSQTPDGGTTWIPLATALSANGRVITSIFHRGAIRAVLAGATSPVITAAFNGAAGGTVLTNA